MPILMARKRRRVVSPGGGFVNPSGAIEWTASGPTYLAGRQATGCLFYPDRSLVRGSSSWCHVRASHAFSTGVWYFEISTEMNTGAVNMAAVGLQDVYAESQPYGIPTVGGRWVSGGGLVADVLGGSLVDSQGTFTSARTLGMLADLSGGFLTLYQGPNIWQKYRIPKGTYTPSAGYLHGWAARLRRAPIEFLLGVYPTLPPEVSLLPWY